MAAHERGKTCPVESGHTAAGLQLTGQKKGETKRPLHCNADTETRALSSEVFQQMSQSSSVQACPKKPRFPNQAASLLPSNCFSKELVSPQTSSSKENLKNIQVPH